MLLSRYLYSILLGFGHKGAQYRSIDISLPVSGDGDRCVGIYVCVDIQM